MEIDPLKYIIVTRSLEIKIRLNSNCMSLRDFQLESDFSFKNRFSETSHPRKVRLNLLENIYEFEFKGKELMDEGTIMKSVVYSQGRNLSAVGNAKWRNIRYPNSFIMEE